MDRANKLEWQNTVGRPNRLDLRNKTDRSVKLDWQSTLDKASSLDWQTAMPSLDSNNIINFQLGAPVNVNKVTINGVEQSYVRDSAADKVTLKHGTEPAGMTTLKVQDQSNLIGCSSVSLIMFDNENDSGHFRLETMTPILCHSLSSYPSLTKPSLPPKPKLKISPRPKPPLLPKPSNVSLPGRYENLHEISEMGSREGSNREENIGTERGAGSDRVRTDTPSRRADQHLNIPHLHHGSLTCQDSTLQPAEVKKPGETCEASPIPTLPLPLEEKAPEKHSTSPTCNQGSRIPVRKQSWRRDSGISISDDIETGHTNPRRISFDLGLAERREKSENHVIRKDSGICLSPPPSLTELQSSMVSISSGSRKLETAPAEVYGTSRIRLQSAPAAGTTGTEQRGKLNGLISRFSIPELNFPPPPSRPCSTPTFSRSLSTPPARRLQETSPVEFKTSGMVRQSRLRSGSLHSSDLYQSFCSVPDMSSGRSTPSGSRSRIPLRVQSSERNLSRCSTPGLGSKSWISSSSLEVENVNIHPRADTQMVLYNHTHR